MRALAFAATAAVLVLSPLAARAWTTEPGGQATDGASFSDPEDKLKELQDKVNAKGQTQSGFFISGSGFGNSYPQYDNPGFQSSGSSVVTPPYTGYFRVR